MAQFFIQGGHKSSDEKLRVCSCGWDFFYDETRSTLPGSQNPNPKCTRYRGSQQCIVNSNLAFLDLSFWYANKRDFFDNSQQRNGTTEQVRTLVFKGQMCDQFIVMAFRNTAAEFRNGQRQGCFYNFISKFYWRIVVMKYRQLEAFKFDWVIFMKGSKKITTKNILVVHTI